MRTESLHEAIQAQPFRPFSLVLANNDRVPVTHPEWILHPRGARTCIIMKPDDSFRVINVGLVLELDVTPPVPAGSIAPNPNGGE